MDRSTGGERRILWAVCLLLLALLAAAALALAAPPPAEAFGDYIHATASGCGDCHADDMSVSNEACIECHDGKTVIGDQTCWQCHDPGESMPEFTSESCTRCHSVEPHLGANADCTTSGCHGTPTPTPHHDAVDQEVTGSCEACHTTEQHGAVECTQCHSTEVHPDYPEVPATCHQCHAPATYSEQRDCTRCHLGDRSFGGVFDNDIHDATLPDGPISDRSCTACHTDKQKHAGQAACLDCHEQATEFHHGTAPSPGYKDCADCHGEKPQHGSGLDCESCHTTVQHDPDPGTPPASVCNQCHASTTFGSGGCYSCHELPVYHAPHDIGSCSSCHGSGRARHAGVVGCTQCHSNIRTGHHLTSVRRPSCESCHTQGLHAGRVNCTTCHGPRAFHDATPVNLLRSGQPGTADDIAVCTQCHFTAEAHASETSSGSNFTCSTCHEGGIHGPISSPGTDRCTLCHPQAPRHTLGTSCFACHWPAVHDGLPDASEPGAHTALPVRIPGPGSLGAADGQRDRIPATGMNAVPIGVLAGALLLAGALIRRRARSER